MRAHGMCAYLPSQLGSICGCGRPGGWSVSIRSGAQLASLGCQTPGTLDFAVLSLWPFVSHSLSMLVLVVAMLAIWTGWLVASGVPASTRVAVIDGMTLIST